QYAQKFVRSQTDSLPGVSYDEVERPGLSNLIRILAAVEIHSLREPTKKMSKSDSSPGSVILLTDNPDTIRAKIRRSQTDSLPGVSYDEVERPGLSNLIRILAARRGKSNL
ncbi:Tryptophanyl-tRNA synthetase, partial [Fasciola gigantica]